MKHKNGKIVYANFDPEPEGGFFWIQCFFKFTDARKIELSEYLEGYTDLEEGLKAYGEIVEKNGLLQTSR